MRATMDSDRPPWDEAACRARLVTYAAADAVDRALAAVQGAESLESREECTG
jgi:hypothetical protein